jgi:NAD(P)-dependent dehydrogenase (short-subunit alcohol dehydrogenase family)
MDFTGKVTLIAGASKGIGAVTAKAFAHAGAKVVSSGTELARILQPPLRPPPAPSAQFARPIYHYFMGW